MDELTQIGRWVNGWMEDGHSAVDRLNEWMDIRRSTYRTIKVFSVSAGLNLFISKTHVSLRSRTAEWLFCSKYIYSSANLRLN